MSTSNGLSLVSTSEDEELLSSDTDIEILDPSSSSSDGCPGTFPRPRPRPVIDEGAVVVHVSRSQLRSTRTSVSTSSDISDTRSTHSSLSSSLSSDRFLSRATKPKRQYSSTKRALTYRGADYVNPKRRKLVGDEDIMETVTKRCCEFSCLLSMSVDDLLELRQRYVLCTRNETNTGIMTLIQTSVRGNIRRDGRQMYLLPTGHMVCAIGCYSACGVSKNTFSTLKKKVLSGSSSWIQLPVTQTRGKWMPVLVPWIEDIAEHFGNRMPDKDVIELSVGNKLQIYQKFVVEHESLPEFEGVRMLEPSWFYELWRRHCSHIKTPKQNRFSKCDICKKFKSDLEGKASHAQRVSWVKEFDLHLDEQMAERKQYYRNREHARTRPDEAMSMIVDGAAQGLHCLPLFGRNPPKSVFGKEPYDIHVMGVLLHHYGPQVFLHDDSTETGPNMTIECVYRSLLNVPCDRLPPLLYLQLDNTASDNKNHHVLEFSDWLVESGIFEEVRFFCSPDILTLF